MGLYLFVAVPFSPGSAITYGYPLFIVYSIYLLSSFGFCVLLVFVFPFRLLLNDILDKYSDFDQFLKLFLDDHESLELLPETYRFLGHYLLHLIRRFFPFNLPLF
jgi:hypothetical protein